MSKQTRVKAMTQLEGIPKKTDLQLQNSYKEIGQGEKETLESSISHKSFKSKLDVPEEQFEQILQLCKVN